MPVGGDIPGTQCRSSARRSASSRLGCLALSAAVLTGGCSIGGDDELAGYERARDRVKASCGWEAEDRSAELGDRKAIVHAVRQLRQTARACEANRSAVERPRSAPGDPPTRSS